MNWLVFWLIIGATGFFGGLAWRDDEWPDRTIKPVILMLVSIIILALVAGRASV